MFIKFILYLKNWFNKMIYFNWILLKLVEYKFLFIYFKRSNNIVKSSIKTKRPTINRTRFGSTETIQEFLKRQFKLNNGEEIKVPTKNSRASWKEKREKNRHTRMLKITQWDTDPNLKKE